MKKMSAFLFVVTLALCVCARENNNVQPVKEPLPRTTLLFNFGWRFHAGDVTGAEAAAFNDADWRAVDLPHDYQIEQPWVTPNTDERPDNSDPGANIRSRLSPRGFKEMGIGWYRKTFTPDAEWQGRRVIIDFEGILYVGDAYLNGQYIGKTDYGYLGSSSYRQR